MIKLINVSKKYGNRVLFENVNIEISKCGIYSFIGENGCGKTTILNVISKFVKANKGKVINKGKVSYLSQKVNLIPHLKIKDHFKMLRIDANNLKKVKMYNKLNSYPFELSQGQRQRVACILALYSNSPIIVCDEPTSHLDNKSSQIVMREILKISKKKIVLLVSHDLNLVNAYSTRIYKIENNSIHVVKEGVGSKVVPSYKRKRIKLNKYYKKSISFYKKNSFLFLMICFVNFFVLLISFNFNKSINGIINSSINNALDYNKFYLKKCKDIEKEVTVKVCGDLSETDINKIKNNSHKLGYNYDLLMNSLYKTDKFNVINTDSFSLKEGRHPISYNEIIATEDYKLGDIINLKTSQVITMEKTDIYNKEMQLIVVGIINKSLLSNKDNYYLDYSLLEEYLHNEYLLNNKKTLFEYFEANEFNNYKHVLYFNEIDVTFLETNKIDYLSASYEYYNSIKDISEEIKGYIRYLNVIVVSFSLYYLQKIIKKKIVLKEDEINFFKALGLKERRVIKIINKENKKIIFNGFIFSFVAQMIIFYIIFNNIYIDLFMNVLSLILSFFVSKKITSRVVKRRARI